MVRILFLFGIVLLSYLVLSGKSFGSTYNELSTLGPNGVFVGIQIFALIFLPNKLFLDFAKMVLLRRAAS
ncbi:MAG: hypothetical protein V1977_01360 [Candidatus Diapherotrites archaeon]